MKEKNFGKITLSNNQARVCVPVMGKTTEEVLQQLKSGVEMEPDIICLLYTSYIGEKRRQSFF